MRYRPTMSTIATSLETTPIHVQPDDIAYDLLRLAQLQSNAVNRAAPNDAEITIDENDYITPERIQLTRTQWEVTRQRYSSQHSYIARSCAPAFPLPEVCLSQSMCANGGDAIWEQNPATVIDYMMHTHTAEILSSKVHLR